MNSILYDIYNELIILLGLFEYGKQILSLLILRNTLSKKQQNALQIFDQSIQSVGLFLSFMPQSPIKSEFKSVAPSLISQIGRALMEEFLTIQYLSIKRTIPEDELDVLIQNQFIDVQRKQMVQQINPNSQELPKMIESIDSRKNVIKSNELFKKLPSDIANNCLNGLSDKTMTKKDILESIGIKPEVFWSTYQHFSQFIHANAFAADQLSALGREMEETLLFLRTMTRNLVGIYCLSILFISYGFDISLKDVPLNIQDSLFFWHNYFRDKEISDN
jgi:hypothetical protein